MSLYKEFKDDIRQQLKSKMDKDNIHEVPKIQKVVVSMGIGSLATTEDKKDFSDLKQDLANITGQSPKMIKSKKSISNFNLTKGTPVMLKTTLRKKMAYDFVEKMIKLVFPRMRDFDGVETRKFDGQGNLNIGFEDQSTFVELDPDDITVSQGVQVNIVTTAEDDEQAQTMLNELGLLFVDNS